MRHVLFTVMAVPFTVDSKSWQFVPPKLLFGLVVAFFAHQSEPLVNRLLIGLLYGVLLNLVLLLHILGHILSSKLVTPPMTEARVTSTLIQTHYDDPKTIAPRIHIIRPRCGPAMNLLLGIMFYLAWIASEHHIALFLSGANWVFMIIVLLPFPTVDGEVIWRESYRLWKQR